MKPPVRVRLQAQTPGTRDLEIELAEGRPWFVVGRGAGVDLSLDDLTVGKRHCQFQLSGGQVKVQNLDHARGTWRNGMPIDDVDDLKEGDRIEIGDLAYQARLELPQAGGSAAPAVAPPPPPPPPPEPAAPAIEMPTPHVSSPVTPVEPPPVSIAPEPVPEPVARSIAPTPPPEPHPVAAVEAPVKPEITRAGSVARDRSTTRLPPINPAARSAGGPPATHAPIRTGPVNPSRSGVSSVRNPSRVAPPRTAPRPEPPAAPPPEPASPALPAATPPASAGPADAFTRNLMEDLQANFGPYVARYGPGELQGLIQRGREQAKKLGFAADEEIQQFMQCVVLLNDELSGQNARNSDVWFTLTSVNRPAPMRLRRALTISQRIADAHGPNGPPADEAPAPAAERGIAPPPSPPPPPPVTAREPEPAPAQPEPPRPVEPAVRESPAPAEFEQPARPAPEEAPRRPVPPPEPRREPQVRDIPVGLARDSAPLPEIEGFEMLGRVGSGGMGDVYRARDVQLDVEVAIKILRSMHPAAQEQFLAEARAAARLQHPHIVQVQRYGQIGDMGYYAMQMIKGLDAEQLLRTLRESVPQLKGGSEILALCGIDPNVMPADLRAAANNPKPYYRLVAAWIAGVADGLERAHAMGVVHRDIKPDNMILASDGRMMLLDFGLAMRKSDDRNASNNLCVGTPRYLSPEMLAAWAAGSGMQGTDERVDIWGLGATLYEFLAFRPAYDGPVSRVLRDIATLDPAPPRECVWQVPEELEAICLKALARNPEERYRRAAEMADELRRWLAGEAPAAAVDRAAAAGKGKSQGIFSWLKKGK